jgi:hypothetical protein
MQAGDQHPLALLRALHSFHFVGRVDVTHIVGDEQISHSVGTS